MAGAPGLEVQIRFDCRGRPLAVRYDGCIWTIDPDADAGHRVGRSKRAEYSDNVAGGSGTGALEGWRVQARNSATFELCIIDLFFDPRSGVWRLIHVNEDR
ncbi:hypothetical protein OOZ51_12725 [Arthrobacter sp. MI7-26]|nr:hypothetical protein [Arthrobacter sp. MI7-26]